MAAAGAEVWCLREDLASAQRARALVRQVVRRWGGLDILVANAGAAEMRTIHRISERDWSRLMDLNLKGVFFCAREALKTMQRQRGGAIVLVGSQAGSTGGFLIGAHYSLSKASLPTMAKILAKEGAPYGVRANCVAPGVIDTDLTRRFPTKAAADLVGRIPLRRKGTAAEVADAVAFLGRSASSYITGITLPVTGGLWMP